MTSADCIVVGRSATAPIEVTYFFKIMRHATQFLEVATRDPSFVWYWK